MNISEYLTNQGVYSFEGYSQQIPGQVEDLIRLSSEKTHIMEIGFNAGHSAEVFLKNNPTLTLTSFDLGVHEYVLKAKEYIDMMYPKRHTLLLGDSQVSVPRYIDANPGKTFDLIFIDGGHDYPIVNADIENCLRLSTKDTLILLDDTIHTSGMYAEWTLGPTRAWLEHVNKGNITEINKVDYQHGRGMSWGKCAR